MTTMTMTTRAACSEGGGAKKPAEAAAQEGRWRPIGDDSD